MFFHSQKVGKNFFVSNQQETDHAKTQYYYNILFIYCEEKYLNKLLF